MENTTKVRTFLWVPASVLIALVMKVILFGIGIVIPPIVVWVLAILATAYPAYMSYRTGTPTGTMPDAFGRKTASWASAAGIVLVLTFIGLSVSGVDVSRIAEAVEPTASLEGKYQSPDGRMEFFKDGTFTFENPYKTGGGKWSIMEGNRIKMVSPGIQPATCDYAITATTLRFDKCMMQMTFQRIN